MEFEQKDRVGYSYNQIHCLISRLLLSLNFFITIEVVGSGSDVN
jgi:hypothetical protein